MVQWELNLSCAELGTENPYNACILFPEPLVWQSLRSRFPGPPEHIAVASVWLQPVTHRHFIIVASRTLNLSAICTLSKQGLSNKEHTDILQADTKALSALTHSFYLCGSYIWASSQLSLAMSCRPTAKNAQLKLCATTCITHTRP